MDRLEILAAWQDFLREKGYPKASLLVNIDPTLLQSSASPSTMYPPINVSNTEPAPPNTNAAPPTAPLSSTATTAPPQSRPSAPTTALHRHIPLLLPPHSAVTSYCSEATIETIELPLPCINGAEPRDKGYSG
ncbi:hypothetical protein BDD12DRAFT_893852 [Trichophaea hybrida]|nr:hypothetical protein BDD12DRAFT_893852 [Trichophaea hybrida]